MHTALLLWLLGMQTSASQYRAQSRTDTLLPLVRISPAQVEQLTAAHRTQDHQEEQSPDWWLIIPTAILAIGTLGLWKATRDLVRGAEKTAERQLRAYVFTQSGTIRDPRSDEAIAVTVKFKNFGQTPAYRYTPFVASQLVTANEPLPDFHAKAGTQLRTQSFLAPGATVTGNATLTPFSPVEREELVLGIRLLYVFGEIRYTDAFGKARFTRFRYVYGGRYGSGVGDLALSEQGNEAD